MPEGTTLEKTQAVALESKSVTQLAHADLVIDWRNEHAHLGNRDLKLTPKELKLLWTLASNPGLVFSREQLLSIVWGDQYSGFEHTVNSHMNRLRSKLAQAGESTPFIHTVWGSGYRFVEPKKL